MVLASFGRFLLVLAGFGWFWLVAAGVVVAGFWLVFVGFGRQQQMVAHSSR